VQGKKDLLVRKEYLRRGPEGGDFGKSMETKKAETTRVDVDKGPR